MTSKAKQAAINFLKACKNEGFNVDVPQPGVVTISKGFEAGDLRAFVSCDSAGPMLLSMLGATRGSQWGTDGGSVGGHSAVRHGAYRLNQSGVPLRLSSAIERMTSVALGQQLARGAVSA